MEVRKAFQFRLKTNDKLESSFARSAGCCRFVWNKALELQKKRLDNKEYCISYSKMAAELKKWKDESETAFLNEVHSQPLQQTLMNLGQAIREAFKKSSPKKFPRFKKKGHHDSFRYPQGFKFDINKVFLPKIGWVPFFKSREIKGTPKNVTVSRRGKHWYFSVQVEMEIPDPIHPSISTIGIDMGVKRFATLSDGSFIEPLSSFRKLEKKLASEQRKLSRKVKFSKNWNKQKEKVSQVHIKIADARNDFLHKTSTTISKNHTVVVLEDLRISNMSKSAKGTKDNPGRNVKAKSGLNKTILDQGWSEFRRQLEYKEAWQGGKVISVPPQYTSQTCPVCGCVASENRPSQDVFFCVHCGYRENADFVAASNILAAGHAVSACGDTVPIRGLAQESPRL
jgi:putative transposase